ncbi:hypothetical protein Q1W71_24590 [Flavobacterium pectinovorum]|uniref:hypothetical protein n=1 Tax=Flavobacterium pectinovorum TaxID=29533 RepID=UPI00265DBA06|nr:hypothetical protein [Flavobacterium pectinovorum]WKL48116.1 hypothetical protein Q1W71_24590 [Flavobacterium pectinovorum]
MESENLPKKTLEGVRKLLETLPSVTYGANVMSYLTINDYGTGQDAFNLLKEDFENLDLSKVYESGELVKDIKKQKKELASITKQHTSLVEIFGEDGGGGPGTLTRKLIEQLEKEISDLIKKRDDLAAEVIEAENNTAHRISEFETKVSSAESESQVDLLQITAKITAAENEATLKVQDTQRKAAGKVRIIEQFSDFLAETNSNMKLYFWVIFFLTLCAVITVALSVPTLLKCFETYNSYLTLLGCNASSWQILNSAVGILIVKLPWALCLSAVFTGMYRLLKSLLITYEKINQDKRNMSAIYAVSGNIASALNDYGMAIAEHEMEDDENGEMVTVLRAKNKEVNQKRESLKWNQIMNYFEGMQHHKVDVPEAEDPDKLKPITDLLGKLIDKVPTTNS